MVMQQVFSKEFSQPVELSIHAQSVRATVRATETKQVRIISDYPELIEATTSGNSVTVEVDYSDNFTSFNPQKWVQSLVKLRVEVPRGSELNLHIDAGKAVCEGSFKLISGQVKAASVFIEETHEMNLTVDAGSVRAERCNRARTQVQAGSLRINTLTDSAKLSTEAGSIRIDRAIRGKLDLQSAMGSIVVAVAPGTAVKVNCESEMGTVKNNLTPLKQDPQTIQNRLELRAKTKFGTVRINRAS